MSDMLCGWQVSLYTVCAGRESTTAYCCFAALLQSIDAMRFERNQFWWNKATNAPSLLQKSRELRCHMWKINTEVRWDCSAFRTEPLSRIAEISSAASPKVLGVEYFDFKQPTVFCLGHRLSKKELLGNTCSNQTQSHFVRYWRHVASFRHCVLLSL